MTMRSMGQIVLLIVFLLGGTVAHAEFKAGAGKRIITPNPLLPISGGLGPTAEAREKEGELTARVVVFQEGDTTVAIVGLDLLGFPSVLCDRVRARVPRIPAKNILIGSTHTHSAPDCYAFPDGRGGHTGNLEYMDFVCQKAAEAVNEALDKLRPARLKVATEEARGKIAYNYYAPDLYDRRMSVVQALDPGGNTIATLVNYAIHPEVLGAKNGIVSPDLVGPLCERIESQVGGLAMFMNGAQGGMITADNRDLNRPRDPLAAYWHDDRIWAECLRIGHTMADEALRIVGSAPLQEQPKLFCGSTDVTFPVDNEIMWNVVLGSPLNYPRNSDRSITTRINVLNLGNAQIVTIPGEALPNIGFYLKRKMYGQHNLLFGLTNDAFGYILAKVDFNSFPRYDYVTRTSLGEMTGEILIERSLEFIEQCPKPERLDQANSAEASDRPARPSGSAFVGRWDVTVQGAEGAYPSWFEIRRSGRRTLVGSYVGQFGSARPISRIEHDDRSMKFAVPPQWEDRQSDVTFEGRFEGELLRGETTSDKGERIRWEARRAPALDREPPAWGQPLELLNGRDLTGWRSRNAGKKNGWRIREGVLQNAEPGNDLVTERQFGDFSLHAEFRYPHRSNSGIYLRGRYEVQIEDDFGREPDFDRIGGVYGFLTPSINSARPAEEWQTLEITLIGRRVTVILNGERVIDRQVIPGITGGALDSNEGEPGPIMIQGDHGPIEFRKLTITPGLERP